MGDKDSPYDELLSVLPASDCRYGGICQSLLPCNHMLHLSMVTYDLTACPSPKCTVYDYQFTNSEGCIFKKLVFLNWCANASPPSNASRHL